MLRKHNPRGRHANTAGNPLAPPHVPTHYNSPGEQMRRLDISRPRITGYVLMQNGLIITEPQSWPYANLSKRSYASAKLYAVVGGVLLAVPAGWRL